MTPSRAPHLLAAAAAILLLVGYSRPLDAQGGDPSGFISDDFNTCTLAEGEGGWTFADPLGGAVRRTVGAGSGDAWAEITVPAGAVHDAWNAQYNTPRIMRGIANADFEIEVKFRSAVTQATTIQGVLIEQEPGTYVRFDFHTKGAGLRVFASTTTAGVSVSRYNAGIAAGASFMRIRRVGNSWTQLYSYNGTTWTTGARFSYTLAPARAGVFAGNGGASPPAFTAQVDYAISTASPVVPEDATAGTLQPLTTNVSGNGTVTRDPAQPGYACSETVTLTATPAAGWRFDAWSGDLSGSSASGSVVMDAPRTVTATFAELPPATPPVLSNIEFAVSATSALITWVTDKAATSAVDYGPTSAYGSTTLSGATTTTHALLLSGLFAAREYHFRVTSVADGLGASSGDLTFTTLPDPSGFVSDDFNDCTLDEGGGGWTFFDPLGGSTRRIVGAGTGQAWLEIAVPAGSVHDPWNATYTAPRLTRAIANTDFEIEVKFLSQVTLNTQVQGILIEQGPGTYVRFDFHNKGTGLKIFAASTVNNVSTARYTKSLTNAPVTYMRVARRGDVWTQSYSFNGTTWLTGAVFTQPLIAARAGLFAGNGGSSPPAHTAQFDYAFSTAAPVTGEDAGSTGATVTLTTTVTGNGTVSRSPNQASYACGAMVTLTATPASGWRFVGWTGDVVSTANPITVEASADKTIGAEFAANTPPAMSGVSIVPGDTFASVSWVTDEPATSRVVHKTPSGTVLGTWGDNRLVTEHSVVVTGLSPETTYAFDLRSEDAGGASSSVANQMATTTAIFPLTISAVTVDAGETSAIVSWATNKPSLGTVVYGTTTAYEGGTIAPAGLSLTHSVTLPGLSQSTEYHYRVSAVDEAAQTSQTGDLTFTTLQITPVIDVWYGNVQRFGYIGVPQRWVNVLGNVRDPDGVKSLKFSLNGGPLRKLTIGPDTRRLSAPGDFNVEIDNAELIPGFNEVRIVATDNLDHVGDRFIQVDKATGNVWPLGYSIDWAGVSKIEDAAQVVDGLWAIEGGTIRSIAPGYDRLVAIGDVTWRNYQVTTSVTVHSVDPAGYLSPSNGPGVGFGVRWAGHSVWDSAQPSNGYWPLGALAWYRWKTDGTEQFQLHGNYLNKKANDTTGRRLVVGSTYMMKVRVETEADGRHHYRYKTWLSGTPEPGWQLEIWNGNRADDPATGSLLLLAHHVNVSYGNVIVEMLP